MDLGYPGLAREGRRHGHEHQRRAAAQWLHPLVPGQVKLIVNGGDQGPFGETLCLHPIWTLLSISPACLTPVVRT